MEAVAFSSPSDAAKHFVAFLAALDTPVKQLPPKEQHRATQLLHEVGQGFHKTIAAKDEHERTHLLAHVRELLTELERLLSGQHMLFASGLTARVTNRYLTSVSEPVTKIFKEMFAILDGIEALIEADTMRQLGIKPLPTVPGKPRVKAPKTYKQAQDEILSALHHAGWAVVAGLKIPHATSPDGTFRFWFKPQAIYFSINMTRTGWSANNARSMWAKDYRFEDPVKFAKSLEHYADKAMKVDRSVQKMHAEGY